MSPRNRSFKSRARSLSHGVAAMVAGGLGGAAAGLGAAGLGAAGFGIGVGRLRRRFGGLSPFRQRRVRAPGLLLVSHSISLVEDPYTYHWQSTGVKPRNTIAEHHIICYRRWVWRSAGVPESAASLPSRAPVGRSWTCGPVQAMRIVWRRVSRGCGIRRAAYRPAGFPERRASSAPTPRRRIPKLTSEVVFRAGTEALDVA